MYKAAILAVFAISAVGCVTSAKITKNDTAMPATTVITDTVDTTTNDINAMEKRVKVPNMTTAEQEELQDRLDQREGTATEEKIAVDGMFQCRTDWICTEGLTSFVCSCNATGVYKP